MKLEKREITLNEADSVKDMYFYEKNLQFRYGQALKFAERKEAEGEISRLLRETEKDAALLEELCKRTPSAIGGKSS
ncbi:MAG: hypothetical protein IJ308_05965 [Clostridia bacterium]|nr:hypothetical protein [Clostridia bacterium]